MLADPAHCPQSLRRTAPKNPFDRTVAEDMVDSRTSADRNEPKVMVLTPVYNGAAFLRECIESVLAQDYDNWEYLIVDNRSTDGTLAIAQKYAARDPRIRVTTNSQFLSMPQNFNHAFRQVSPDAAYCKVICADDWILPGCIRKMVALAENHPNVGIVGCYQRSEARVRWAVFPPSRSVIPGREACRFSLINRAHVMPPPTAALYRADLLRTGRPFFPNDQPHSDTSACFAVLDRCDLGVVHEVLAVERVHLGQITSQIDGFAAGNVATLELVLEYGPRYLTADEFATLRRNALKRYFRSLGRGVLKLRGREFWDFQFRRMAELGVQMNRTQVAIGTLMIALSHLARPASAVRKVHSVIRFRIGR